MPSLPAANGSAQRDGAGPADRPINLLLLASSLWIGGAETVIRQLAETLDRRQFTLTVACLKQIGDIGNELIKEGIDVIRVSPVDPPQIDYLTSLKLRQLIRERGIDLVHTHTAHGLLDASLVKLTRPNLKIVHTFHFGNYPHTAKRILQFERTCWRAATRLVAVGDVQRGQIREVHRIPDDRIGTIHNGVRMPLAAGDPAFRAKYAADGALLIGTIATLIDQKGLFDLLEVAHRLKQAGAPVRFVICGEGVLRRELEARRRELDVDDMVSLAGWVTSAADVALPTFDIFFQPSLWEAMSVVTLEAMAAGKPLVATRVGEAPRIIQDGVDGLLTDPKDVDGMAAALRRLVADAGLRERMGAAARATIQRSLTVEHMTRNYERLYRDCLG
jgi:glycosyltransferase involved in cell wall biosynthesis